MNGGASTPSLTLRITNPPGDERGGVDDVAVIYFKSQQTMAMMSEQWTSQISVRAAWDLLQLVTNPLPANQTPHPLKFELPANMGVRSWILKFSAKKVVFLVSRGKKQISPLLAPPRKIFVNIPLVPPSMEKPFRRPCQRIDC